MEPVLKFLKKLQTLVVDRRFITYLGAFLAAALAMPELLEQSTALETQVIDLISAVAAVLELVVGLVALLQSWGVRAPSGIDGDDAIALGRLIKKLQEQIEGK